MRVSCLFILTAVVSAQAAAQKQASQDLAIPDWEVQYVRQTTWHETLIKSWQAELAAGNGRNYGGFLEKLRWKQGVWEVYCPLLFRDFNTVDDRRQIYLERTSRAWDRFLSPSDGGQTSQLAQGYHLALGSKGAGDLREARNAFYREQLKEIVPLTRRTIAYVEKQADIGPLKEKFARLEKQLAGASGDWVSLYTSLAALRRMVLFEHPALAFDSILVNKHEPPKYSHNCDQYLGVRARPGRGLWKVSGWKTVPTATPVTTDQLPVGDIAHPTLSFDAERVIFGYACKEKVADRKSDVFHIYEAAVDGSWVKQLTGTAKDKMETADGRNTVVVEDFDPAYLPGGGFVFTSTRSQNFGRCHGSRYAPSYLLYRADADGSSICPISYGEANEHFPSILNDGRVIFTRWEYNNRNQIALHKLWWIRPDGTGISNFYGVNSATPWSGKYHDSMKRDWYEHVPEEIRSKHLPYMLSETRAIPNSRKVVVTACGHHSYTAGTLMIVDPDKGEDGFAPLTFLTPEIPIPEAAGWGCRGNFMTPCPVNEDLFFAAYSPHPIKKQGQLPECGGYEVMLIDSLGGREPIYRDPAISSVSPLPVIPRRTPAAIPSQLPGNPGDTGTLIVQNVYLTRNDPAGVITKGDIKALRVIEMISKPERRSLCAGERNDFARKILGTVPVNEDGSATFTVPAGKPIFLQALDRNGMALLTERTLFHLMPGEVRSCVGCHEPVGTVPLPSFRAQRMRPKQLTPPAGPQYDGGFSFSRTVQPVLDRYCIECHGLRRTEKKINLMAKLGKVSAPKYTRGPDGWAYIPDLSSAWHSLTSRKGFVKTAIRKSNFGPDSETVNSRPKDFFAHAGKLVPMLMKGHQKVQLDPQSMQRIIEWCDLNYIRFGGYDVEKPESHVPSEDAEGALRDYIKQTLGSEWANQPLQALVNVVQPDESRVLMAPLAVNAEGWGQVEVWGSRNAPAYVKMRELVLACAAPSRTE